jgi:hypothetical protein
LQILNTNPGCKYLRVYNGFDADDGKYVTYIAAISDDFDSFVEPGSPGFISKACCQCNPCTKDKLLNP